MYIAKSPPAAAMQFGPPGVIRITPETALAVARSDGGRPIGYTCAMAVQFCTHISSSRGNCVELRTDGATLLLDCGFNSQRDCNQVLDQANGELMVLISHAHSDHLSDASAKALNKRGVPIRTHVEVLPQLTRHRVLQGAVDVGKFTPFGDLPFTFGPFLIRPFRVKHAPGFANFGFAIEIGSGSDFRKLIVCTDLCEIDGLAQELRDADLIYIESNHDPELLRIHPNPASRYHLSNHKTADLLCAALRDRSCPPQAVILGHLSRQRNCPELALETIDQAFKDRDIARNFDLVASPLYERSPTRVIE